MSVPYHGWTHRPKALGGTDPGSTFGAFELKVFADTETASAGDGVLIMMVPEDLNGTRLSAVAAGISTEDLGDDVVVMVSHLAGADMLSTPITIDEADMTSYTSVAPPVIDAAESLVATGDLISIDVVNPGTNSTGLMVVLVFG